MDELLLSQKQYWALVNRLDLINNDVTQIKLKTAPELGYIDNRELLSLLQVSNRTIQRWRKDGRLPYSKIGEKFYYRVDLILARFKTPSGIRITREVPSPEIEDIEKGEPEMACKRCPLFLLLNM